MNSYVLDTINNSSDFNWSKCLDQCDPRYPNDVFKNIVSHCDDSIENLPYYLVQRLLRYDVRTYAYIRKYDKEVVLYALKRNEFRSLYNMYIPYKQLKDCWNTLTNDHVTIISIIKNNDLIGYIRDHFPDDYNNDDLLPYVRGGIYAFRGIFFTSVPKLLKLIDLGGEFYNIESFKLVLSTVVEIAPTHIVEAILRSECFNVTRQNGLVDKYNIDYLGMLLTISFQHHKSINSKEFVNENTKSQWQPYQRMFDKHILVNGANAI